MKPRGRTTTILVVLALLAGISLDRIPWQPASPIDTAFEAEQSDVWVESEGIVERLLPDDTQGSRHQRIIVRIPSGRTVLIAHNIDLAPRVEPLRPGDRLRFRGEYEWNDKGGVVHWTHHDPSGRRAGGWIELGGRRVE
jgi:hypothetical protein